MNKIIQRKAHSMFGRVAAFVLAFAMAVTMMPAIGGGNVVKAADYSVENLKSVDGTKTTWDLSSLKEGSAYKTDDKLESILVKATKVTPKGGYLSISGGTIGIPVGDSYDYGKITITGSGSADVRILSTKTGNSLVYNTSGDAVYYTSEDIDTIGEVKYVLLTNSGGEFKATKIVLEEGVAAPVLPKYSGVVNCEYDLSGSKIALYEPTSEKKVYSSELTKDSDGKYTFSIVKLPKNTPADKPYYLYLDVPSLASVMKMAKYEDGNPISVVIEESDIVDQEINVVFDDITNAWDFTNVKESFALEKASGTYKSLVIDASSGKFVTRPYMAKDACDVQVNKDTIIKVPVTGAGTLTIDMKAKDYSYGLALDNLTAATNAKSTIDYNVTESSYVFIKLTANTYMYSISNSSKCKVNIPSTIAGGSVVAKVGDDTVNAVAPGTTVTFNVTPEEGYHLVDFKVNGASVSVVDNKYECAVSEDTTIDVTFDLPSNAVTMATGVEHGTAEAYVTVDSTEKPVGSTMVKQGTTVTIKGTPDTNYALSSISVKDSDDAAVEVTGLTFVMPAKAVTVTPVFAIAVKSAVEVSAASTNCTVTPDKTTDVLAGETVTFTVEPSAKYIVESVSVKDAEGTAVTCTKGEDGKYTFTMPFSKATIEVKCVKETFELTVASATNGTVEVKTTETIASGAKLEEGTEVTITTTPNTDCALSELKVTKTGDAETVVTVTDGKFSMPAYPVTVTASFISTKPTVKTLDIGAGTADEGISLIGKNKAGDANYKSGDFAKGLKTESATVVKVVVDEGKYAKVEAWLLSAAADKTTTLCVADNTLGLTSENKANPSTINYVKDAAEQIVSVSTSKAGKTTNSDHKEFKTILPAGTYYLINLYADGGWKQQGWLHKVVVTEYSTEEAAKAALTPEAAKVAVSGTVTSDFDLSGAKITLSGKEDVSATITGTASPYAYTMQVPADDKYTVKISSDKLLESKKYMTSLTGDSVEVAKEAITNANVTVAFEEITSEWDFTLGKYETKTYQGSTGTGTIKGLKVDATASGAKFDAQSSRVQVNPGTKVTVPVTGYAEGTLALTFTNPDDVTVKFGDGESSSTVTTTIPADATEVTFTVTAPTNGAYLTKITLTAKGETKPEGGETKPEGGETKPEGGETKPEGGETKPEGGETKPEGGNTTPEGGNTTPEGGNTTPEGGNTTPEGGNTTPEGGNTTPEGGNTTPEGGNTDNKPAQVVEFKKDADGNEYWYEDGVKQGTEGRGKEIYDPKTDAWYWLDAVDGGKKAVSKDVFQESNGGKWVRYDAEGKMVKGWDKNSEGTYYFDPVTGAMTKGAVEIEGTDCYFDEATGIGANLKWITIDGVEYWYENGVRQGQDKKNEAYRGKEIYDPETNAWYWLDNVDGGKKAVSKDVYQESLAGDWGDIDNGDGTRNGKWVRYDENGHMIKGWSADGNYYFDPVYGTMAKGAAVIDGKTYNFDQVTGILVK